MNRFRINWRVAKPLVIWCLITITLGTAFLTFVQTTYGSTTANPAVVDMPSNIFEDASSATTTPVAKTEPAEDTVQAPPDFFGIVGRDPWYEFNTDPVHYPNQLNIGFLETMAQQMEFAGARWIRIEFHADAKAGVRGGYINYAKYDAFINQIAPKYHLKVLALVAADAVIAKNADDQDLYYPHLNDQLDSPTGANPYIRFFANRVKEIADHYGNNIQAFEIMNEENNWLNVNPSPNTIGALISYVYEQVKPTHQNTQLILGGIASSNELNSEALKFLDDFYHSTAVQNYFYNGVHYTDNRFPFDGIGWHPYYNDWATAALSVREVIKTMRDYGDQLNKLWVTETSYRANVPVNLCGQPSDEEQTQANYLLGFYRSVIQSNLNDIATVFWFKYEDFSDNQFGNENWGLVHLKTIQGTDTYAPSGEVVYYKAAYRAYQSLANPQLPSTQVNQPTTQYSATNTNAPYYFPQTQHTLSGAFLQYWLKNGGLSQFGLPLTEPFYEVSRDDGKRYLVQYFERNRFELHPENAGTPFEVQLGLLGNNYLSAQCRYYPPASIMQSVLSTKPTPTAKPITPTPGGSPTPIPTATPTPVPTSIYFPQTGHNLSNGFKYYWQHNGGVDMFGYPVSEEMLEVNPDNGNTYVVQYFQRARFEYHPEFKGTAYETELGLLGRYFLEQRGWVQ